METCRMFDWFEVTLLIAGILYVVIFIGYMIVDVARKTTFKKFISSDAVKMLGFILSVFILGFGYQYLKSMFC